MHQSKITNIISFFLLLVTTIYIPSVNAEIKITRESWGTSRVFGTIDEMKFDFRVVRIPFSKFPKDRKEPNTWKGIDSFGPPKSVISSITFQLDNKLIKFPISAFHDLGSPGGPYSMKLENKDNKIFLILKGGDGTGSYTSIFIIENNKLIERQIKEFTPDGEYNVTGTIKFNS